MKKRFSLQFYACLFFLTLPLFASADRQEGVFTITDTSPAAQALSDVQIVCAAPVAAPTGCPLPTGVTTIPTVKNGNAFTVYLGGDAGVGIVKSFFPNPSFFKCGVGVDANLSASPVSCNLVAKVGEASSATTLADFQISLLGAWNTNSGSIIWGGAALSGVSPHAGIPNIVTVTGSVSNDYNANHDAIKRYNGLGLTVLVTPPTPPAITPGRIALTQAVATAPAKLACTTEEGSAVTFTADTDTTSPAGYFDFEKMFKASAPDPSKVETPTTLTNCTLEDSAATPTLYATISSISNLAQQTDASTNKIWAANVPVTAPDFAMGIGNFLVTNSASVPAATPGSYNQYNISIKSITAGAINFGGDIADFTGKLSLTCDGTTISLPATAADLYALHNSKTPTTADTEVSFNTCTLENAAVPGSTFASFSLTGLKGTYTTEAAQDQPMWAAHVDSIKQGNDLDLIVDTEPVTSVPAYQDPTMFNQTTINFHNIIPGKINVRGIPSDTILRCDGGKTFSGTSIPGGLSFDLSMLHGSTADPTVDVTLANCTLFERITSFGVMNINAINATRIPASRPTSKMWSAGISGLSGGLVNDGSDTCDTEGTFCANWNLRVG